MGDVTAPDGKLKPEEQAAGEILAAQLGGGTLTPRDIRGAPAGTHDLGVEGVPGVVTIALEVTSDQEEEMLLMYDYAARRWDAPGLRTDWFIGFDGNVPVDVIALVHGLEDELRVLEQHGIGEMLHITPSSHPDAVAEVQKRICARGITVVSALKAPSPGEPAQLVLGSHRRFSAHAGQVNAVVVRCAERKAEKLRRAEVDKRHLFVWVDSSAPELAMATHSPPPHAPDLPGGLDVAWAGTRGKVPGALCEVLWRLPRQGGWVEELRGRWSP